MSTQATSTSMQRMSGLEFAFVLVALATGGIAGLFVLWLAGMGNKR